MSRISHYLFFALFVSHICIGQQKSNDFTRRVSNFDGKLNRYSGKSFMNSKLNLKLNNRIKIEEWPTKYSPFGGKRFVSKNSKGLIKKRIPWQTIPAARPFQDRRAELADDRVMEADLNNRSSAASAVEFRDEFYSQLDKRVDDWLNKVNNVSLQEINRYQFRKGRPSEPGFPVQQAGSAGNNEVPSKISHSSPKNLPVTGKPPAGSSYWLGPQKTSVRGGFQLIPQATRPQPRPNGGYRVDSQPILGPKKVRIQVGKSK